MLKPNCPLLPCVLALAVLGTCGCQRSSGPSRHKVAFVTNCVASFWTIAEKGVKKAAAEENVEVLVRMPTEGVAGQKRMCEELLTVGVEGIAISPIDPANQSDLLDMISSQTRLITHDSDADHPKKLCYVGMDNYEAGRMCGQLVKEVLPQGGKIVLFVGNLGQLNAQLRRQGLIDELLGRSPDNTRRDPAGNVLEGNGYVILDTRTDQFDFARAKSQAQDAIVKYPDLDCMVGLFAYNPPKCLEAIKEANKLDQIKLVAFDEDDETLQGILDGHIHGTVVQNPFEYGYQSVRILAALARGEQQAIPQGGFLNIPARLIRRDNARQFWDELKALTADAQPAG